MSKTSLAVKYRPQTFEEVSGQTITTTILKRAIATGTFKNSLLFAGASGTGKTSCARLFAKAINNGIGEPIEIDAASYNSVDNVRAIMEQAKQRSLEGEYKVFVIDECHAITSAGWQAFLKGIEETPKYTVFIFCTTEMNKIPHTILNRVQIYNFTKIPATLIKQRLLYVCEQEHFTNYENTCELLSHISQGGMRDALTYLDRCTDYSTDLCLDNTKKVLGDFSFETMMKLTNILIDGNECEMLKLFDTMYNEGRDLKAFISNYLEFSIELVKYILYQDITLTNIPNYLETAADKMYNIKYTVSIDNAIKWFNGLTELLLEIKTLIKNDTSCKTTIEAKFLKLCRG